MSSKILLFLAFFISVNSYSNEAKGTKLNLKLMILLDKEIKTLKALKRLNDKYSYRLIELLSEKAQILQNQNFNTQFSTEGQQAQESKQHKILSDDYKKVSKDIEKYAKKHFRQFKNTKYRAEIYYTMALNARDFTQNNKKQKEYLILAKNLAKDNKNLLYKIKQTLGEYYYNNKEYLKSEKLYSEITKNENDTWLTKNLYIYAWTQFKTKKFNQALKNLERSHLLSKNKEYIDIREQVEKSLTIFYTETGELDRGISFLKDNSKNYLQLFFDMSDQLFEKSDFKSSLYVSEVINKNISHQTENLRDNLNFLKLKNYYSLQDMKNTMLSSMKLRNVRDENTRSSSKILHQKIIADHQDILKTLRTSKVKSLDIIDSKLSQTRFFLESIRYIDQEKEKIYYLNEANLLYSFHKDFESLSYFKKALCMDVSCLKSISDPNKHNKEALKSIYTILAETKFKDQESKEKELIYAYESQIKIFPQEKETATVYSKLFYIHLKNLEYKNSLNTLMAYQDSFKNEQEKHLELYQAYMAKLINNRQVDLLNKEIKSMQKNQFGLKATKITQYKEDLATILFKEIYNKSEQGDHQEAIQLAISIYNNDNYPIYIKNEAGYHAAVAFSQAANFNESVKWLQKILDQLDEKKIKEIKPSLDKMLTSSLIEQDFINAAHIGRLILGKYCEDLDNKEVFSKTLKADIVNNYLTSALRTYDEYKKCTKDDISGIQSEILFSLFISNEDHKLLSFTRENNLYESHQENLSHYLVSRFWVHFFDNNKSFQNIYLYEIKKTPSDKTKTFAAHYNEFTQINASLKDEEKYFLSFHQQKQNMDSISKFLKTNIKRISDLIKNTELKSTNLTKDQKVIIYSKLLSNIDLFKKNLLKVSIDTDSDRVIKIVNKNLAKFSKKFAKVYKLKSDYVRKAIDSSSLHYKIVDYFSKESTNLFTGNQKEIPSPILESEKYTYTIDKWKK